MPHQSLHSSRKHSTALRAPRVGRRWPLVAATALLWISGPATAAVYKWTDANGRVVYSDQPPPVHVKSETLSPPPPPANPNALKELVQKDAELRKRQAQRTEGDKKAEQVRADAELRRTQCAQVRGHIGQLSASQEIVYRVNEKGERTAMDDAARRKERDQLEAWLRDNCAG